VTELVTAVALGIIEGMTEFIPVSSTGHMRLAEGFGLAFGDAAFGKTFDIFIQVGAILAVVVYFRHKLLHLFAGTPMPAGEKNLTPPERLRLIGLVAVASLWLAPAAWLAGKSEKYFGATRARELTEIAVALAVGGLIMIAVELLVKAKGARTTAATSLQEDLDSTGAPLISLEKMPWWQAVAVGFFQVIAAVFPGTSRSAATIMSGMALGQSRQVATEFSFFLAIPAMFGAAAVKLIKFAKSGGATGEQYLLLLVGTCVAFLVGWAFVAVLMAIIRRYSFIGFGVYRIAAAAVVLWLVARGQ
jgi:undecaprenyl-diphosphatase